MMYILQELHPVGSMATLDNTKGGLNQIATDSATGNIYVKRAAGWTQLVAGGSSPAEVGLAITVKNSASTITRSLTETGGVVKLAATDTIVANNDALVLKNHAGTVSSGNAGLNSAGTVANVAAGVVSSVTAGT